MSNQAFVVSIQGNTIEIVSPDHGLDAALLALEAVPESKPPETWSLQVADESELPAALAALRDLDVAFAGGTHGWPPAEIFADYRARGLLSGDFWDVVFSGPGQPNRRRRFA
jgi:hypothetical protein